MHRDYQRDKPSYKLSKIYAPIFSSWAAFEILVITKGKSVWAMASLDVKSPLTNVPLGKMTANWINVFFFKEI